jgi:aminoglycoside 3-N-acetyltransferase
MYSREELTMGFRRLGVRPGQCVMLHASVRAVGPVAGGPDQIHLALKDALAPEGTLIMYAGCPAHTDEIGRGCLTGEQEREILEKFPVFEPSTARSQRENGTLVEFLRTYPGSTVNEHVARFVVWGRRTTELVSPQPWNYAFGLGSLLDRFVQADGRIVLVGCDHDNVTFLHYVEHIVDIPDKRVARFKVPVDERGVRVWRAMEEFDTSGTGAHPNWPQQFFARIVHTYLRRTSNHGGHVGNARTFVLGARGLLEFASGVMREVAADRDAARTLLDS